MARRGTTPLDPRRGHELNEKKGEAA